MKFAEVNPFPSIKKKINGQLDPNSTEQKHIGLMSYKGVYEGFGALGFGWSVDQEAENISSSSKDVKSGTIRVPLGSAITLSNVLKDHVLSYGLSNSDGLLYDYPTYGQYFVSFMIFHTDPDGSTRYSLKSKLLEVCGWKFVGDSGDTKFDLYCGNEDSSNKAGHWDPPN